MRDFIIAGQGIAGTMLGLELEARGLDILVVDDGHLTSSTRIAAGLITPLTGRRLALTWRAREMLATAIPAYRKLEEKWSVRLLEEIPTCRIFQSLEEEQIWAGRQGDATFSDFLGKRIEQPEVAPWVNAPHGGGWVKGSAWVNLPRLLDRARLEWSAQGRLISASLDAAQVKSVPGGVKTPVGTARMLIWCDGYRAEKNPSLQGLPFRSARGDILTLRCNLPTDRIWNTGIFVQPHGGDLFKAGATYDWDHLEPVPSPAGREELEEKLRGLLRVPFEVVAHEAGVRPVAVQRVPVAGRHPRRTGIAALNGLGSKGTLQAPAIARMLADHLLIGSPLPDEIDLGHRMGG